MSERVKRDQVEHLAAWKARELIYRKAQSRASAAKKAFIAAAYRDGRADRTTIVEVEDHGREAFAAAMHELHAEYFEADGADAHPAGVARSK